jgi:hypothetical protein
MWTIAYGRFRISFLGRCVRFGMYMLPAIRLTVSKMLGSQTANGRTATVRECNYVQTVCEIAGEIFSLVTVIISHPSYAWSS